MENTLNVREVGMAQRLLILAVLVAFLGNIVSLVFPFIVLVTIPFQLYCVYKMSMALKMGRLASILFMLGMFLPLINLILLLVLNSKASKMLKDEGIKVGFMGANKSDLPADEAVLTE